MKKLNKETWSMIGLCFTFITAILVYLAIHYNQPVTSGQSLTKDYLYNEVSSLFFMCSVTTAVITGYILKHKV